MSVQEQTKMPLLVILLLIIHTAVFLVLEGDQQNIERRLQDFFIENKLDTVISPLYTKFMQSKMTYGVYAARIDKIRQQQVSPNTLYIWQHNDPFFQQWLLGQEDITQFAPVNLIQALVDYNELKNSSILYQYGYTPSNHQSKNILLSIFLHQNIAFLLLTLVLLYVGGGYLEQRFGMLGLLFATLVSIGSCISLIGWYNPLYPLPLALALPMACFLFAIYAASRTRYYMGGVLIIGLGIVLFALNYYYLIAEVWLALANAICAFVFVSMYRAAKSLHAKYQKSHFAHDAIEQQLKDAQDLLNNYQFIEVKPILRKILDANPQCIPAKFMLYQSLRFMPSSREYHQSARHFLSINTTDQALTANLNIVFKDYKLRAIPYPKWDLKLLNRLLQRFRKAGYYQDAEWILQHLRIHYKYIPQDQLAHETYLLAQCYLAQKDKHKGQELLEYCAMHFSQTVWGQQSKQLLAPGTDGL